MPAHENDSKKASKRQKLIKTQPNAKKNVCAYVCECMTLWSKID